MKHQIRVGLGLFTLTLAVLPASAQEGDARAGLKVAQGTCAACHAIRKDQQSANAGAPAFDKIASVPGMTAIALQASLQTSHRSMPNLILSTEDPAERGCLYLEFATQMSRSRGAARYPIPHAAPNPFQRCRRLSM